MNWLLKIALVLVILAIIAGIIFLLAPASEVGQIRQTNEARAATQTFGAETLELPNGEEVAWRGALIKKLIALQKIDAETGFGYWQNENNRWWENDPALVTAYTIKALAIALYGGDRRRFFQ